jgi:hypothetical protein
MTLEKHRCLTRSASRARPSRVRRRAAGRAYAAPLQLIWCNPLETAEFESERLGCSDWDEHHDEQNSN